MLTNAIQWSMRFEDEEVKVVALGTAWVAAVTSLNFLRIFTEGGLQVCHVTPQPSFYVEIESIIHVHFTISRRLLSLPWMHKQWKFL